MVRKKELCSSPVNVATLVDKNLVGACDLETSSLSFPELRTDLQDRRLSPQRSFEN